MDKQYKKHEVILEASPALHFFFIATSDYSMNFFRYVVVVLLINIDGCRRCCS